MAFTEQGVAMLSGVLNGPRAIAVNIAIMRAFVRMRAALAIGADMRRRLEQETAARLGHHKAETDRALKTVFAALQRVSAREAEPEAKRERLGFKTTWSSQRYHHPRTQRHRPGEARWQQGIILRPVLPGGE